MDFLVTQLFFDNAAYFDFIERARAIGIDVPIIPGILPITNIAQLERITSLCGAVIPEPLRRELDARADEPEAVEDFGVAYATQAGLFFAALQRLDASLLALVLYTYPAWVMLGSLALGREQPTRRRVLALALSSAGLVVLLAGASAGAVDAVGVAMGIGASLAYTVYILVADRAGLDIPPLALTALVCVGAMCTLGIAGVASGSLSLALSAEAWMWLGLIAVVSTAVPIVAFFAGLARVGPSTAAILSSFEPVVTVALAYLAFSEVLSGVQLVGAALVLGAAVLLATPVGAPAPPD